VIVTCIIPLFFKRREKRKMKQIEEKKRNKQLKKAEKGRGQN